MQHAEMSGLGHTVTCFLIHWNKQATREAHLMPVPFLWAESVGTTNHQCDHSHETLTPFFIIRIHEPIFMHGHFWTFSLFFLEGGWRWSGLRNLGNFRDEIQMQDSQEFFWVKMLFWMDPRVHLRTSINENKFQWWKHYLYYINIIGELHDNTYIQCWMTYGVLLDLISENTSLNISCWDKCIRKHCVKA